MLAGMQDEMTGTPLGPESIDFSVGDSMFETMGKRVDTRPSPDVMAQAMDRLQIDRKVEVKEYVARTYDLGDAEQRNQYQYDMETLFFGLRLRTHAVISREPLQFVNDDVGPRYIAHLQWIEFRLLEEPVPTVGSSKGADHGSQDESS
jgi:hypothetical protein